MVTHGPPVDAATVSVLHAVHRVRLYGVACTCAAGRSFAPSLILTQDTRADSMRSLSFSALVV